MFEYKSREIKINDGYVSFELNEKKSNVELCLGSIDGVEKFVCCHREELYMMNITSGKTFAEIPYETQWLLIKCVDKYVVILPFVCESFRVSLAGEENGSLSIYIESGDEGTVFSSGTVACIASGNNPYLVIAEAAKLASAINDFCVLRSDKIRPEFCNYFGWCTWDSFYDKVTMEDIINGLENFAQNGLVPKMCLLDDGWQSVEEVDADRGKHQLCSFKPNEKFKGSLKELISEAKSRFGVKNFLVWHAIMGYWGGVSPNSPEMSSYNVKCKQQKHSQLMHRVAPKHVEGYEFPSYGFVSPDKAESFYDDYHSYLRSQGVDGVKIDVQAAIEGLGYNEGGRGKVVRTFRQAIDKSVNKNFNGSLINCMSCSNDIIMNMQSSSIIRTSSDFNPRNPKSHLRHIYVNAIVSMYIGAFAYCDWDMFQTKHEYGKLHAAARAISGGPVYVSDKVGEHDITVIKKLAFADGRVPLPDSVGVPSRDSLFFDFKQPNGLFKIYNKNKYNRVIGVFNLSEAESFNGKISPQDAEFDGTERYVAYMHNAKKMLIINDGEEIDVLLNPLEFELITISKIENGAAPIGITDKYNSGGCITKYDYNNGIIRVQCMGEKIPLIYSESTPKEFFVNGILKDWKELF